MGATGAVDDVVVVVDGLVIAGFGDGLAVDGLVVDGFVAGSVDGLAVVVTDWITMAPDGLVDVTVSPAELESPAVVIVSARPPPTTTRGNGSPAVAAPAAGAPAVAASARGTAGRSVPSGVGPGGKAEPLRSPPDTATAPTGGRTAPVGSGRDGASPATAPVGALEPAASSVTASAHVAKSIAAASTIQGRRDITQTKPCTCEDDNRRQMAVP